MDYILKQKTIQKLAFESNSKGLDDRRRSFDLQFLHFKTYHLSVKRFDPDPFAKKPKTSASSLYYCI